MKAQTISIHSDQKRCIQILVLAALALPVGICFAQNSGQSAEKQAITLMQQQMGLDTAAPNERNPQGLHIQFQSISDVQMPEGHSIRYRLLIPGAPEKQSYFLAVWRIGVEVKYTPQQVFTNAKGLVMWHLPLPEQEQKESLDRADEIEVDLRAARGEPIRYILASQDGKFFCPGTVVPYPIESRNGNCRLEARLGYPDAEGVLVYLDGLKPGSTVPLQSVSEGETHAPMLTIDGRGHAGVVVAPNVAGKDAGVVKISVTIPGCMVGVEVPWGRGSYRPM